MKHEKYFEKNGIIYGVSSSYDFGWSHTAYAFDTLEEAREWLATEEQDFRERELCTLSTVRKLLDDKKIQKDDFCKLPGDRYKNLTRYYIANYKNKAISILFDE